MLYTDLNMNAKNINNVSSITISGFASSNFFLKTDGTIDENDYITASSTEITNLQNKTQNITASSIETTFNKNNTFILSTGGSDYFTIRDDNSPASNLKVGVSNTSITFQQPLFMNGNVISLLSDPVSGRDASNRNYVDGVGALKLNIDGSNAMTGALNMNSKNIVGAGSVSATSLTLGGASTSILRGNGSTISGTASQYVMGNGTLLTATYPKITTGSFAVQWTGGAGGTTADRNISWRRLSDGISTTVWLTLPVFSVTIGTANSNFGVLMTVASVPANLQVANQPHLPIIVSFAGVIQCGWLVHYGTSFGVQQANKQPTVVGTAVGIPNVAIVSYMI